MGGSLASHPDRPFTNGRRSPGVPPPGGSRPRVARQVSQTVVDTIVQNQVQTVEAPPRVATCRARFGVEHPSRVFRCARMRCTRRSRASGTCAIDQMHTEAAEAMPVMIVSQSWFL